MKKNQLNKILGTMTAILMLFGSAAFALADSISFDGTVTADDPIPVFAEIGGVVEEVLVNVGDTVEQGQAIARLKTTKVYAQADGTVRGIFGQPGDSAETVSGRYGAVLYVEEDAKYTISASTSNAYSSTETKFVHIGEEVFLKSAKDSSHTGTGIVTAADGINYTVEFKSGELMNSESVEIFRSDDYSYTSRLGKGTVSRKSPTTVTGTGSIVAIHVKDGDTVKRGDLLLETLDGTFDGCYMSGIDILASESGIVAEINLQAGQPVQKDAVAATLYSADQMTITAEVNEADLGLIHVGDSVKIELNWNMDSDVSYIGVIRSISSVATTSTAGEGVAAAAGSEVTFKVRIDFTPDADTRYGMSATISTNE